MTINVSKNALKEDGHYSENAFLVQMDVLNAVMALDAITVSLEKHLLMTENVLITAPTDISALMEDAQNALLIETA
jgi:hypothetical protein